MAKIMKTKSKYADNVLANIRWFAEHRHDFDFCGKDYFHIDKVQIYTRRTKSNDAWEFTNEMSRESFSQAFNWPYNSMPKFPAGELREYRITSTVEPCIVHDTDGVSAIDAFIHIDSYGTVKPTRHPALLKVLLRTKASLNLFIQMYAEDRANGCLPKELFQSEIVEPFKLQPWMVEAVEQQKWNYYKTKQI